MPILTTDELSRRLIALEYRVDTAEGEFARRAAALDALQTSFVASIGRQLNATEGVVNMATRHVEDSLLAVEAYTDTLQGRVEEGIATLLDSVTFGVEDALSSLASEQALLREDIVYVMSDMALQIEIAAAIQGETVVQGVGQIADALVRNNDLLLSARQADMDDLLLQFGANTHAHAVSMDRALDDNARILREFIVAQTASLEGFFSAQQSGGIMDLLSGLATAFDVLTGPMVGLEQYLPSSFEMLRLLSDATRGGE